MLRAHNHKTGLALLPRRRLLPSCAILLLRDGDGLDLPALRRAPDVPKMDEIGAEVDKPMEEGLDFEQAVVRRVERRVGERGQVLIFELRRC